MYIGFCFKDGCGLVCIDLDDKTGPTPARQKNFEIIINQANSYTEISKSGLGFHVICKADMIDDGRKHDATGIEVYKHNRFIVITGNVGNHSKTINSSQAIVDHLISNMPVRATLNYELVSLPQTKSDEDIIAILTKAKNSQKFLDLMAGNWEQHYPGKTHNSASLGLCQIVAFHTRNFEQVERIYKMSQLYPYDAKKHNARWIAKTVMTALGIRMEEVKELEGVDLSGFLNGLNSGAGAAAGVESTAINEDKLIITSLEGVKMKAIEWLWNGWIPKGYLTLVAGESGAAKSTLLTDIAARETTGKAWPGTTDNRAPGRVLWLGSEDGVEELIVPRLHVAHANLKRFFIIKCSQKSNGVNESFSLQDDIKTTRDALEQARLENNPYTLFIIDPITSYLPGRKLKNMNMDSAQNLRFVLEPWLIVAQEFNLAIVCISHFSKDTKRQMIHRVLGSTAFIQTCRSLLAIIKLTEEGDHVKALLQLKNNLPETPEGGWKFETIKEYAGVDEETEKPIYATTPKWLELRNDLNPESLMNQNTSGPESVNKLCFMQVAEQLWGQNKHVYFPIVEVKEKVLTTGVSSNWWNHNYKDFLDKDGDRCKIKPYLIT